MRGTPLGENTFRTIPRILKIDQNVLRGTIPDAVGFMTAMTYLWASGSGLQGPIPHGVGSLTVLYWWLFDGNSLRGTFPHAACSVTAKLLRFDISGNSLSGPIPYAVDSMTVLQRFHASENSFCGLIPQGVGSMTQILWFFVSHNCLRGPIPDALCSMTSMQKFAASGNSLAGAIPAALRFGAANELCMDDNQLSGSIPGGVMRSPSSHPAWNLCVLIHRNRLTGTLPVLNHVGVLTAFGNLFEGRLPSTFHSELGLLDLSGAPGRNKGLNGPLPPALRQASQLRILMMADRQMDGSVPLFASTLSVLALHEDGLEVLPDIQLEDDASKTAIFLHDNLLSCYLPECGNSVAKTSVIAIGNQLRYPKREFPAWVLEYERDPLLWVAGDDGMSLVRRTSGAVGFFMLAMAWRLSSVGC